MSRNTLLILAVVAGLCMGPALWATEFELIPTFDIMIGNDSSQSATSSDSSGSGMHIRDVDSRRRVGFAVYDLSEVKELGVTFSDVKISNYGHDTGDIQVYGVLEEYEDLVTESTSWSTAPGVVNDLAQNAAVELNLEELTDLLLTFDGPSKGTREETDVSEELSAFLTADTTGIAVLMFAPPQGGNAILRTIDLLDGDDILGGSWLVGEIGGELTSASAPSPSTGLDDVYSATDLTWKAGADAETHTLYMSTNFDDVNEGAAAALVAEGLTETVYTPESLVFGETYYWRVDEVGGEVYPGMVWNFTVEPEFYTITDIIATASSSESEDKGPEKTIDGSGLNDDKHDTVSTHMWMTSGDNGTPWIQYDLGRAYNLSQMKVWNGNVQYEFVLGYGVKDVLVETSLDADTWTEVEEITEFAPGSGFDGYVLNNTFELNGLKAQYVRLTALDNFTADSNNVSLSEVQFTYAPTFARVIAPVDEATDVDVEPDLAWRAGRGAIEHQIYLGADANLVAARDASTLVDTIVGDELSVDGLVYDTNYYWAVDAIFEADVVSGDLWSFTTPEYLNLEDFDSYTRECTRIFYYWLDGYGYDDHEECDISAFGGNGSSPSCYVGYWPPDDNGSCAETSSTYAGIQSMPFEYNNTESPYYSEAKAKDNLLASDWTVGSPDNLTLFVKGNPADMVEVADDHLIVSGAGADIYGSADEFRYVYKNLNGDGSIVARVASLENTNGWAKAGLMIRASEDDAGSANVLVYVSPENGLRIQNRASSDGDSASDTSTASDEQKAVTAPVWLKLERVGSAFSAYYSMEETVSNWIPASGNPVTVAMVSKISIGLAVCSHEAGLATVAEFTDIVTSSSVSGDWEALAVGADMPVNSADPMYVKVTDGSNKTVKVTHDNAELTQAGTWQQWDIPLSTLNNAGLDLTDVKTMAVGVGDGSSSANGTGIVLIDEVRLTRSAD